MTPGSASVPSDPSSDSRQPITPEPGGELSLAEEPSNFLAVLEGDGRTVAAAGAAAGDAP